MLLACQQINTAKTINTESIDWNALQFTCSKEQNPAFDDASDALFQRARALEKANNQTNDAEMVRLYQQAAKRGHYKALLNLAGLYIHGTGVAVDEGKALDLVERAMKMQSAHAYYSMGVMLQQGIGVKKDKAADMGNRYGQAATGENIIRAFQLQPEPARSRGKTIGRQALECALSQDLANAGHALGVDYLIVEKDIPTALEYFQKAASLGSKDSLFRLYFSLDRGEHGIPKDPKHASCYDELLEQLRADPNKRFPDIDQVCPLPPLLLPH
ncbi:tetratricopeptide repeat protein [Acinetobacter guillouiae]|nr:tetratricopeptide repeat protein [Acinetobacter guillouiae]